MCIKTTTLNDNLTIPKGAIVVFTAYLLQHDQKYWDDPEKFNPDRLAGMIIPDKYCYQLQLLGSQQKREPSDLLRFTCHLVMVLVTALG